MADDLGLSYQSARKGAYEGDTALAELLDEFPAAPVATPAEDPNAVGPDAPDEGLERSFADSPQSQKPEAIGQGFMESIRGLGQQMGAGPTPQQMGEGGERGMAAASDVALGVVETVRNQALGGVRDATQEVLELTRLSELGLSLPEISQPQTVTGGLARSTAQFLTGFVPAFRMIRFGKAASSLATAGRAALAGAVSDATVFDPQQERLSNLVQSFPVLQNPITDFLESEPGDSEAMGRFKNAVEGLGIGGMVDGLAVGLNAIKQARRIGTLAEEAAGAGEAIVPEKIPLELGDPTKPTVELVDEIPATDAPPMFPVERADPLMDVAKIQGDEIAPEGFEIVTPSVPAKAVNINLSKLDTTDDVKEALATVGDWFRTDMDDARRGVITQRQTEILADNLGMTPAQLLERRKGQAFNAEEALAARKILESSGSQLVKLARKAAVDPRDSDLIAFRRSLALHHAIQAQVSGATAEAGRSLASFKITAKGGLEQARAIRELIDASGGADFSRDMAAKLATLTHPRQIAVMATGLEKATSTDMVLEAWINGLLSGPQTHVVNMLSNSITSMWQIPERFIASQISGSPIGAGDIAAQEAVEQMFGLVYGARDGFRMASKAFKSGEASDLLGKVEAPRRAISAENLNVSGAAGRFADFMGEVTRLPSRFLTASDEFFKGIGYRMELHALAFRQARGEGLEGPALAKRTAEIIAEPPETIHLASVDAARYQTFTSKLGQAGATFQASVAKFPAARFIIPFIRTPVNIMKFAGERSPLAPLSKNVRQEIAAGGARRDLALAKIASGSMLMSVFTEMAASGSITGGDLMNRDMAKIRRETGWQPYSLLIGDTYYAYNRLDPIGITVGIAADLAEILPKLEEQEGEEIAAAAVLAISKNMVSKTYLEGVSKVIEIFDDMTPELGAIRGKQFYQQFLSSFVPNLFAQIARTEDPTMRHVETMVDAFKARLPEYREDLPPRRNIWGDPIVLEGGIGPDIMSPIYASTKKEDPVSEEILRLDKPVSMPPRNLGGVELSPEQYDRFVLLAGKEAVDGQRRNVKQALRDAMKMPAYKRASDGPDGTKSAVVQQVIRGFRQIAEAKLMNEFPELFSAIQVKRMEAARALAPQR